MIRLCRADLHIHSLLSPCAEVEMIPELILAVAEGQGLDMIAVCDHNAAENAAACYEAAKNSALKVLPGIECESREGVHILALFDNPEQAMAMQDFIWGLLPQEQNRPEFFGQQMVVTPDGEFSRYEERLLATGADISVEDLALKIRELGGQPVPSHVDQTFAGLFGVLGFAPEGMKMEAVEISPRLSVAEARFRYPQLAGVACIHSSDAHRLNEIGTRFVEVRVESRCVSELTLAFCGREGRSVEGQ